MKRLITRNEFGKKWPFTIESGYVYSISMEIDSIYVKTIRAAIFESIAGVKYQLNGIAESMGYTLIDPIWRDDLNIPIGPDDTPAKINIGPMIEMALENEGG